MPESFADLLENWWPRVLSWVLSDGLAIVVLLVLLPIALWFVRLLIGRLKKVQLDQIRKVPDEDDLAAEKRINTIFGILQQVAVITLYIVFGMTILTHLGVEVGPLLASVGVVGLALGFGSQELVRDVVSGLFNLIENNIRVGDVVSINGVGGAVEKVELRTTVLRGYNGTLHVFQNGKINTLSNLTKEWSAAVLDIGVDYQSDLNQVFRVMRAVGESIQSNPDFTKQIKAPVEVAGLDQLGESALVVKVRFKTSPGSQWAISRQYLKEIKEAFDQEGINIPFPHRTIYMNNENSEKE
ncbi:MAG: mechanosensitive ion channel family protein [Bacteroidota bacterium]